MRSVCVARVHQLTCSKMSWKHHRNSYVPARQRKAAQRQRENDHCVTKSTSSKTIRAYFTKQWQNSWDSYKSRKLNPSISITTDLNSKRLHIHEGLAKAESSLATQKCGWYRQTAKHVIMFCPLYHLGGRGAIGSPTNYHKLVNTAQTIKSITSRLFKTGLLAQYSVAAEQLYGQ